MKIILRNIILSFTFLLLIGNTSVSASMTPTAHLSTSISTYNSICGFLPFDSFSNKSSGKLLQVNSGLQFNCFGFAQMGTRVYVSNSSNYVKITMQLQKYKSGKWNTVTSASHTGKGLSSYNWNYYVSKGYKYRVKNNIYLYKTKNKTLLDKDTCYSRTVKR